MKRVFFVGLFVFGLCLPFAACQQKGEIKGRGGNGGPVVAKIDGQEITLEEFNERLKEYPSLAHSGEIGVEVKKGFLDNLITRELLYQEALRTGIDKEKETADFIEEMKRRVVVDRFFKKEVDEKVSVSAEEVKKFFTENPDEAKSSDEVRASHILLKTREEAEMVRKKIKAGSKFEDLAKQYSIDPGSKGRGGDLGYFQKGMMVPEFDTAAFKLKTGEVSDIVETRFGYHLIKVTGRKEGKKKGFEEVSKELEKKLLTKKRKERFDTLVAELKSKAKITINEDILKNTPEKKKADEK